MFVIFLIIAGILNALMDAGEFYNYLPFNPHLTWRNKYKNEDPQQGEKFFLSTTVLVFLTDRWHLSKTLMVLCFLLTALCYKPIFGYLDIIFMYLCYSVPFEIVFRKLK